MSRAAFFVAASLTLAQAQMHAHTHIHTYTHIHTHTLSLCVCFAGDEELPHVLPGLKPLTSLLKRWLKSRDVSKQPPAKIDGPTVVSMMCTS